MKNIFVEKKASKTSLSLRKLVYGVGINDSEYIISYYVDDKQVMCPYYSAWINMLERCYSGNYRSARPAYIGCTVAEEWHKFSAFKKWMEKQNWQGKHLDKDILIQDNKTYSSKACVFVNQETNKLLTHIRSNKGDYPTGVSFDKSRNKYMARCNISGKEKYLGRFATPEKASDAYKKAKREDILRYAIIQTDDRIRQGLIRHANFLISEAA